MSERQRILNRIRKCLRLAESPEPHEAAAALRQAQALMAEHGVSEAELRLADVETRQASAGRQTQRPPSWLARLAQTVAECFGCSVHYHPKPKRARYVFVGVAPAAQVAEYAFTVLLRQCSNDRRAYYRSIRGKRINRIRRADAYAMGWVLGVHEKVEAFARPVPDVVGQYLQEQFPGLQPCKTRNRATRRDLNDAARGVDRGSQVDLRHGMTGTSDESRQLGRDQ